MVGNDVVDLRDTDADPGTLHPRFDARVFSRAERGRLAASPDVVRERWSLWAAKEASYKLARKHDSSTVFSPIRFEVDLEAERSLAPAAAQLGKVRTGRVSHGDREYRVRVSNGADFVHAIATPPVFDAASSKGELISGLARLGDDPSGGDMPPGDGLALSNGRALSNSRAFPHSRAVRRLAREAVARRLGIAAEDLEIRKHGRVPVLYRRGRVLEADLSLSHHGDWLAFAWRLGEPQGLACTSGARQSEGIED